MKVIIIAAGKGNRLMPLTDGKPKCLLEVGGKTIIERTLEIFRGFGLNEIAVVRGYEKEKINFPGLTYFENDDYENNNILQSLFCARNFMDRRFISSYSDIVYRPDVVEKLLAHPADISIVADIRWRRAYRGRTKHPITEAELVAVDSNNKVTRIGKDVVTPNEAHGEFIGLAKFSDTGVKILTEEFKRLVNKYRKNHPFQNAKEFKKAYLTDMFQELVDRGYDVHSVNIEGGWSEIDVDQDLERANRLFSKQER